MPRPDSLQPAACLAMDKPHGTRIKYIGGCRCIHCRAANSRYESQRAQKRRLGLDNGLTPANRARKHLMLLSRKGIGRRTVSMRSGVSQSIIAKIRNGQRNQIRKDTERKILSVSVASARPNCLINAAPAWKMINSLLDGGFTKAELAQRLSYKSRALQIGKDRITAKNAAKICRFHATIMAA